MNEQQNVALIQKMYDAFARGDVQTIINSLTPEVEWSAEGPSSVSYFGKLKGPEEVRSKFFGPLGDTQKDQKLTPETWVAQGDHVAMFGRYRATVTATGKQFDSPVGHLFRISNGKISKFINLGDTAAVAAAYGQTASSSAA